MTSFDYADSQFRFTYPIRFFKANDPIYYEVDNIPLKQLQENDLWLKDQIFNLKITSEGGVERANINELRPYVGGFDNVVKVKPGRFTARINDAYNLPSLQVIKKILGDSVEEFNVWTAGSIAAPEISDLIQRFKQAVAINLNGLVERAFTKLSFIPDYADTTYSSSGTPTIAYIRGLDERWGQPSYAQVGAVLWNNFTDNRTGSIPSNYYTIRQYDDSAPTIGFARLPSAETAFIKKWRGIARTAVVDVAEELSITIPPFDDDDYFYYDEQGIKQYLPATQRVDLVFIYSKPVDTSSVTVAKFVNGSPTTITKPQLGIVYGAGLGVNFKQLNERIQEIINPNGVDGGGSPTTPDDSTLPDGTIKILAHYGDESGLHTGFETSSSTIKASFPAPDDLMNISPLLDESLNSDNIALIGQSVLPVAYVLVRKNPTLTTEGVPIINSSDLVDIRPFFRTTELAYNERAGIAAAVPSISLANPVVSQAELDHELKKFRNDLLARIPTLPDVTIPSTTPGGSTGSTGGFTLPTFVNFYIKSEWDRWFGQGNPAESQSTDIFIPGGDRYMNEETEGGKNWGTPQVPIELVIPENIGDYPAEYLDNNGNGIGVFKNVTTEMFINFTWVNTYHINWVPWFQRGTSDSDKYPIQLAVYANVRGSNVPNAGGNTFAANKFLKIGYWRRDEQVGSLKARLPILPIDSNRDGVLDPIYREPPRPPFILSYYVVKEQFFDGTQQAFRNKVVPDADIQWRSNWIIDNNNNRDLRRAVTQTYSPRLITTVEGYKSTNFYRIKGLRVRDDDGPGGYPYSTNIGRS